MTDTINVLAKNVPSYYEILKDKEKPLIIILVLWELGFLALVFIINIFFSHKIAGPIHKTRLFFDDITKGKGREVLTLRKGDYFQDFAQDINKTFDYIYQEYQNDFLYLDDVIKQLNNLKTNVPEEKRESIEKIINHLIEMQSRFAIK